VRAQFFALLLTGLAFATAPALAQTTASAAPASSANPAHKTPPKAHAKTATRPAAKKLAGKKPPIVSPRHGATPRHPVHPRAAAPAPKAPAKPAPKPAAKAPSKPALPANVGTNTGLPLPRYASLKTDDINMRSGPGARYPVLWTYKRRELPVRIEREFDVWRLVEDMDGVKGWVNGATLTGRRTFVVTGTEPATLRAAATDTSEAVAILKPGVVGRLHRCDAVATWCEVQAGGYRGYLPRSAFWGTDAGEAISP
jgi:SH3-like domain-containing protein